MSGMGWDTEVNAGAVHGRFVPGLPWDGLPPPVWEPIEGEGPDPLVEQLRKLNNDYTEACNDYEYAQQDAADASDRKRDIERDIEAAVAEYRKVAPGPAAALIKELDLPVYGHLGWEIEPLEVPDRGMVTSGYDAAFIAVARTEVPRLLDRVTALEKAVQLAIDVDHLNVAALDAKYPELVVGDPAGNHWSERYIATLRAALSQEATQGEGTDGRG